MSWKMEILLHFEYKM